MRLAEEPPPEEPPPPPTETVPTVSKPGGVQGMVKDPSFLIWSGVLAGVLLLAALAFMLFDRWRKRPAAGGSARDEANSFGSFRQMYENGEITEAEYDRIRAKMAVKMKEKLGIPIPPPPPPEPPPAPPGQLEQGTTPPDAPPPT